ncbi:MAG: malto-oligosyltrehalose synthase [Dehalococcoidia bacterium]
MTAEGPRRRVASTYRLQLHRGFTFDDARALLPYLVSLGVTHLYLSPITIAAPGSTHGYDVVDPTRLDPEFGGEEGYARLVQEQQRLGLGQVVDIVPNHMGVASGSGNAYWEDVLRHGPASEHARIFDIDWTPDDPALHGRVLLPLLGDELDAVLARGELTVERVGDEGWLRYYDHRLPLRPGSLDAWDEAEGIAALVETQHYRLGYWRTAKRALNYRRFFAVDDLAGVHAEDPAVFDLTHGMMLRLVRSGAIDGLRVDHPDGLRDPEAYLARLRAGGPDAYVVVEKILAAGEPLPETWDCDGTTGYDFMAEVPRVLTASEHEARFTSIYDAAIAGAPSKGERIAAACRADVLRGDLGGQFERIARRLHAAVAPPIEEAAFVEATLALLAHIEVYRTYHRADALDPRAAEVVRVALDGARASGAASPGAIDVVAGLLAAPPAGAAREAVLSLQQIMPAVQAKGLEDRAFYRDRRLLALNEVGGDPSTFGEPVEVFHARIAEAARRWPQRMLATATHDHKRGEDLRARLAALSEFPDEWAATVERTFAALDALQAGAPRRVEADDLYLFVQTLVGCHPVGMTGGREGDADLAGRLRDYMLKALREAGERTDWVDGDEQYERAVEDLVARALDDPAFDAAIEEIVGLVAPAGAVNSLAQALLKAAAPGVPDTYQGNELWDFTLVDPDNRRAVDFALRERIVEGLAPALDDGLGGDATRRDLAPALLARWRDGALKTYVLARALRVRRARSALFLDGSYEPLAVEGERAAHVIAFMRRSPDGDAALAVTPRLPRAVMEDGAALWSPRWGDTALGLPLGAPAGAGVRWRDAFTGAAVEGDVLRLSDLLGTFPVALLLREPG